MKILFRLIFIFSLFFLGLAVGTYFGGKFFVPKGSGLAGGPMALGYGLVGAFLFGISAFILSLKIPVGRLRTVSLTALALAGGLLIFLSIRFNHLQKAKQDPDSAYSGLELFRLTLKQTVIIDPYLITHTELDSAARSWATTLPDGRVCRGQMRAAAQTRITRALLEFSRLDKKALAPCFETEKDAQRLLIWDIPRSNAVNAQGELKISPACEIDQPVVANVVEAALAANRSPTGPVKCR